MWLIQAMPVEQQQKILKMITHSLSVLEMNTRGSPVLGLSDTDSALYSMGISKYMDGT